MIFQEDYILMIKKLLSNFSPFHHSIFITFFISLIYFSILLFNNFEFFFISIYSSLQNRKFWNFIWKTKIGISSQNFSILISIFHYYSFILTFKRYIFINSWSGLLFIIINYICKEPRNFNWRFSYPYNCDRIKLAIWILYW